MTHFYINIVNIFFYLKFINVTSEIKHFKKDHPSLNILNYIKVKLYHLDIDICISF